VPWVPVPISPIIIFWSIWAHIISLEEATDDYGAADMMKGIHIINWYTNGFQSDFVIALIFFMRSCHVEWMILIFAEHKLMIF
jgi:hypothetical protein